MGSSSMTAYGRLDDQKVNLHEQHDASEFFNTLADSIDEGLKSFGTKQVVSGVLGDPLLTRRSARAVLTVG